MLWVPGDGSSAHQAGRKNPNSQDGSKRFRTSDDADASSSGQPKKIIKKNASKPKTTTHPDEMRAKEFVAFCQCNLYHRPQDEALVSRPFWTW